MNSCFHEIMIDTVSYEGVKVARKEGESSERACNNRNPWREIYVTG